VPVGTYGVIRSVEESSIPIRGGDMAARLMRVSGGALLASFALGAALAGADGLPVLGGDGNGGVVRSTAGVTYRTLAAGRETRVLRLSRQGALTLQRRLAGGFVVPVVAYDGSSAGLSADDRTLVLIHPRLAFPQAKTQLAILDARTLRVRRHVPLPGDFSFDAISPDGAWIYLIQYTSPVDPTRYRVRALDARTGRLLPHDIVDPHDRGESMRGSPITRATSVDGRWAYTLYDGVGAPFVHALDTSGRRARCIDVRPLAALGDARAARLTLTKNRTALLVTVNHRTVAAIDTRTFAVSAPHTRAVRGRSASATRDRGSSDLVLPIVGLAAILAAAGVGIRRRARRPRVARRTPSST
jgi:hypothetical protein